MLGFPQAGQGGDTPSSAPLQWRHGGAPWGMVFAFPQGCFCCPFDMQILCRDCFITHLFTEQGKCYKPAYMLQAHSSPLGNAGPVVRQDLARGMDQAHVQQWLKYPLVLPKGACFRFPPQSL